MKVTARVGDTSYVIEVQPLAGGEYEVKLDGETCRVDARRVGRGGVISLLIGGKSYETHVDGAKGDYHVALVGSAFDVQLQDELAARIKPRGAGASSGRTQAISAPMPGLVVEIRVSPGERVEAGQPVAIVEAMKMQNELTAPATGVVSEVHVKRGDAVASGQPLVTLETK